MCVEKLAFLMVGGADGRLHWATCHIKLTLSKYREGSASHTPEITIPGSNPPSGTFYPAGFDS